MLACKDWLRFCLAATVGTDRTEASTSFTDVGTQAYAPDVLRLFGLDALTDALPPVSRPDRNVGRVTAEAARVTALVAGTPVVAGLHDVTASALGIGGYGEGIVAIVAGTYSINETVSSEARVDARWFCRNGHRGPASGTTWRSRRLRPPTTTGSSTRFAGWNAAPPKRRAARSMPASGREIEAAFGRPSTLLFHPYLFGSPHGPVAQRRLSRACAAGMTAATCSAPSSRASRSITASISTRCATDSTSREARLTGGISRNPPSRRFSPTCSGMPVTVTETEEAAAWGAALCAGAGVGLFASPQDDPRDLDRLGKTYSPGHRHQHGARRSVTVCICDIAAALAPTLAGHRGTAPN